MSILLFSVIILLLPSPSISTFFYANCANFDVYFYSSLNTPRQFSSCVNLPYLSSCLHYTHDPVNSTLSFAFTSPTKDYYDEDDYDEDYSGWISWGIGKRMIGAQSFIAFTKPDSTIVAATANITQYGAVSPSPINYETWDISALLVDSRMTMFGTVKLPSGTKELDIVWQLGPMKTGGVIGRHPSLLNHTRAFGTLNLEHAVVGSSWPSVINWRIHEILNVVSWGLLLPIGSMMARLLKVFKPESAMWFYLHVSCQLTGYVLGVIGYGIAVKLDGGSIQKYKTHSDIGHALVALATLQVFLGFFLRRDKENKGWCVWTVVHLVVGYIIIGMSVYNVFEGLSIMRDDPYWRTVAYTSLICILATVAFLLEIVRFIVQEKRTRKPVDDNDDSILKYNDVGV